MWSTGKVAEATGMSATAELWKGQEEETARRHYPPFFGSLEGPNMPGDATAAATSSAIMQGDTFLSGLWQRVLLEAIPSGWNSIVMACLVWGRTGALARAKITFSFLLSIFLILMKAKKALTMAWKPIMVKVEVPDWNPLPKSNKSFGDEALDELERSCGVSTFYTITDAWSYDHQITVPLPNPRSIDGAAEEVQHFLSRKHPYCCKLLTVGLLLILFASLCLIKVVGIFWCSSHLLVLSTASCVSLEGSNL